MRKVLLTQAARDEILMRCLRIQIELLRAIPRQTVGIIEPNKHKILADDTESWLNALFDGLLHEKK